MDIEQKEKALNTIHRGRMVEEIIFQLLIKDSSVNTASVSDLRNLSQTIKRAVLNYISKEEELGCKHILNDAWANNPQFVSEILERYMLNYED